MPAVLPQARGLLQGRRRVPRRARLRPDRQAPGRRVARREAAPALADPRRLRRRRASRPASRAATTSTAATTKASATSRSTSAAGIRWNATKAFLRPALPAPEPAGLDRRPHQPRASSTAARATGVEIAPLGGGAPVTAQLAPGGEVDPRDRLDRQRRRSCSCRASAPPALLRRTASRRAHALPGVGENLQDHLQIRAVYGVEGAQDAEHDGRRRCWGKALIGLQYALEAQRPDEHGAVAARRLHAQQPRARRTRTSSTTCSRSRSMPSASRCIASTPSPRACATSTRPAAATSASARPIRRRRRASRPTTCRPTTTATSPPRACA